MDKFWSLRTWVSYALLAAVMVVTLLPFLWLSSTSFKDGAVIADFPPTLIPGLRTAGSFAMRDIRHANSLAAAWKRAEDQVSRYLVSSLPGETKRLLAAHDNRHPPAAGLKTAILAALNNVLSDPGLYADDRFSQVALRPETRETAGRGPTGTALERSNRELLEQVYPYEIVRSRTFTGANYPETCRNPSFLRSYWNSIVVSVCDVVFGVLVCSLAGFAFAKYDFKFKNALFCVVLVSMMIPVHILIIPLYLEMKAFRLLDTLPAVILPFLAKPYGVFFMRQYYRSLPDELLEAARMDGASEYFTWFRIVLPLSRPACGVLACLFFVESWNALLWPMIALQSKQTVQMFLQQQIGRYGVNWGALTAGSCLAVLPVLLLFLTMQKHIVSGLTAGAVK
ncbi:MAG: carbohydrate ABC transporter permease [Lentisphaerae bacterium]|nr:carbohydrate ABC transporter permease [Lentisphaerota bacterium]